MFLLYFFTYTAMNATDEMSAAKPWYEGVFSMQTAQNIPFGRSLKPTATDIWSNNGDCECFARLRAATVVRRQNADKQK